MKIYILLSFSFFICSFSKAQNYLKICDDHRGGRDGFEVVNIIAIDTSSIKKMISGNQKEEISLDINNYYQLDTRNYFSLIKYLKTKNLLYSDIKDYEFGQVFEITDEVKKETFYLIRGISVIKYKEIRSKIAKLSKIKPLLKLFDNCFK